MLQLTKLIFQAAFKKVFFVFINFFSSVPEVSLHLWSKLTNKFEEVISSQNRSSM